MLGSTEISLARPYAKAAFAYALEDKALVAWSRLLARAAAVIQARPMQRLVKDLRFDEGVAYECLCALCKSELFLSGENFLRLVASRRRLFFLPAVHRLFSKYQAEQANRVMVQVVSARPLHRAEQQRLSAVLEKRLQREVVLDCSIASDVLGGLVIRVGDLVIDDSVRGKLERLHTALVN